MFVKIFTNVTLDEEVPIKFSKSSGYGLWTQTRIAVAEVCAPRVFLCSCYKLSYLPGVNMLKISNHQARVLTQLQWLTWHH